MSRKEILDMPINGFSNGAAAMRYLERRQEIASHNLANVETTGFKAGRVFGRLLDERLVVADVALDLTPGALRPTGSPLDVALEGQAFLVVETENGPRLTRGGSFRLDGDGRVVDANGNALQTETGDLTVGAGAIDIGRDGIVRVDGAEIGRLRLVRPAAAQVPQQEGAGLFVPTGAEEAVAAGTEIVRQGHLEASNVGAIEAMVDMISIQRAYATVQKAMTVMDGVRETIANALARPG
jgi:flagellar basal-body rod protein FlgF